MSQLNKSIDKGVADIHDMANKMDDVVEQSPAEWWPGCLLFVLMYTCVYEGAQGVLLLSYTCLTFVLDLYTCVYTYINIARV